MPLHMFHQEAIDECFKSILRNHLLTPYDLTGEPVARTFKQHKAQADRIAATLPVSAVFTTLQRHPRGVWLVEWTSVHTKKGNAAARRKAVISPTIEQATEKYNALCSYHSSHYFRPEEGLKGLWNRL